MYPPGIKAFLKKPEDYSEYAPRNNIITRNYILRKAIRKEDFGQPFRSIEDEKVGRFSAPSLIHHINVVRPCHARYVPSPPGRFAIRMLYKM
jgi:hypothetical protein